MMLVATSRMGSTTAVGMAPIALSIGTTVGSGTTPPITLVTALRIGSITAVGSRAPVGLAGRPPMTLEAASRIGATTEVGAPGSTSPMMLVAASTIGSTIAVGLVTPPVGRPATML